MEVAAINCSALMAAVRLLCMYATKHNVTHRQPILSGSPSLYWLTGRHARGDNVCRRSQEMMDITRSRSRNPVPMWCVRHDIITRFAHNQCGRLSLAAAGRTLDESNYMCRPSELWATPQPSYIFSWCKFFKFIAIGLCPNGVFLLSWRRQVMFTVNVLYVWFLWGGQMAQGIPSVAAQWMKDRPSINRSSVSSPA